MNNDDAIFRQLGTEREVLTVSQLNARARRLLEEVFPAVWVEGELSNLARPSSGHLYFTLKDSGAQVRCALFRQNAARVRMDLRDGLLVRARGRVSLYEGRGDYQMILDAVEPAGDGALRQAFEALKARLQAEGLFAAERKRPLPSHPTRIGVITSPSGAAVRDIISVFGRRAPFIELVISPTAVQGREAAPQIVQALERADRAGFDALILARGGGSLEDLWPFNEEMVARAVAACRTPVISAVGHETDVSIADFVADVRAATPSAAAEIVLPDIAELRQELADTRDALIDEIEQHLADWQVALDQVQHRLSLQSPAAKVLRARESLGGLSARLAIATRSNLERRINRLSATSRLLDSLHPAHVLARGFAIVENPETGRPVRRAVDLPDRDVEVHFEDGRAAGRLRPLAGAVRAAERNSNES